MSDDPKPLAPRVDPAVEELLAQCIEWVEAGETDHVDAALSSSPFGARVRRLLDELVGQGIVESSDVPVTDESAQSSAPASIGRYRVIREVARGGQGIVYLAEDPDLVRRVALKVLRGRFADSAGLVSRFRREAEVASKLSHPGICTVYEASVADQGDGNVPFIAMEFLQGETLADRIRKSREEGLAQVVLDRRSSTPSTAAGGRELGGTLAPLLVAFQQIARALHAAHEFGVVHRDVKPSNVVLVEGERGPVLTDFGLARDARAEGEESDLTRSGELFGTPEYMSPEQVGRNFNELDRRSDVWSLGVSLFECLTLRRPFEAPTSLALYRAIESDPTPDPRAINPAVPRDLAIVLERCLEKDREHRYRTALDVAEELRRIVEQRPIVASPAGRLLRLKRWAQREPVVAASLASVFALLLAGLAATSILLASRDAAISQYQQMADATLVERLLAEEAELWPAVPRELDRFDTWLRQAEEAVEREPLHAHALAGLHIDGGSTAHADTVTAWRAQVLGDLLTRLGPLRAALDDVRERRAFAIGLTARTIEEHRESWDRCTASVRADARFRGLTLPPQLGLVPLGRDRDSGLWEFFVHGTGTPPEWDGAEHSGKVVCAEDAAIVLVLLPPEDAWLEGASEPVRIPPFFCSKFETTQAQWIAITGDNPAYHRAGSTPPGQGAATTLRNPVENVDWDACTSMLARYQLELPTQLAWEYAARAGTETSWSTGEALASLQGAANLADRTAARFVQWDCTLEVEDGFIAHAPVGSFEPNPFGLHDVHGNVAEWCSDRWEAPGGADYLSEADLRGQRGGSFFRAASWSCSHASFGSPRREATHDTGVRAVRRLLSDDD